MSEVGALLPLELPSSPPGAQRLRKDKRQQTCDCFPEPSGVTGLCSRKGVTFLPRALKAVQGPPSAACQLGGEPEQGGRTTAVQR